MKLGKSASFILSVVIAFILMWVLFSYIDKASLLDLIKNFYWPPFLFYLVFSFFGFLLRSLRYCWLIGSEKLGLWQMYAVIMVRQVFVDLLPMKVGELSYVVLLKKRFNVPVEIGMSSMMVVFLFDCLSLFPVLFLCLIWVGSGKEFLGESFIGLCGLFIGMIILALWQLDWLVKTAIQIFDWLRKDIFKLHHKFLDTAIQKGFQISEELLVLKKRKIYLNTFFLTFGIRLFKYLSMYSLLMTLLWVKGELTGLSGLLKMIIALAGAEITTFLPVQGLAGFGTWEAAWTGAFVWMGLGYDLAVLTGFGTHLLAQITEYVIGGVCLLLLWAPKWRKN